MLILYFRIFWLPASHVDRLLIGTPVLSIHFLAGHTHRYAWFPEICPLFADDQLATLHALWPMVTKLNSHTSMVSFSTLILLTLHYPFKLFNKMHRASVHACLESQRLSGCHWHWHWPGHILISNIGGFKYKACGWYSITFLNVTPIFDWCLFRWRWRDWSASSTFIICSTLHSQQNREGPMHSVKESTNLHFSW